MPRATPPAVAPGTTSLKLGVVRVFPAHLRSWIARTNADRDPATAILAVELAYRREPICFSNVNLGFLGFARRLPQNKRFIRGVHARNAQSPRVRSRERAQFPASPSLMMEERSAGKRLS